MASTLHSTCVAIAHHGVLLLGESGAGKSDLALRLIDDGAQLVSDDYTDISEGLIANAPERLKGLLEVRGLGIIKLSYVRNVKLALAVKLVARELVERLPEPAFFDCLGAKLPLLSLHAFDASTPAKIRLYLQQG